MKKINEKMIVRNGKLVYAICIEAENFVDRDRLSKGVNSKLYVYINDGKVHFSDNLYSSYSEYSVSDEAHRVAKEIFIAQLRTDIKTKVMELKQLEMILTDINLPELLQNELQETTQSLWGSIKKALKA